MHRALTCLRLRPALTVFALAAGIRLGYVAADLPVPLQDTPDYDELAHSLLAGRGFAASQNWHGYPLRSWRAPFYPFFLAGVYGCCGYSHLAVQLVQVLLGALSALLVYRLARRVRPDIALIAGLLTAAYGPLAACCAEIMTEAWYIFWTLLSLLLLAPVAVPPRRGGTGDGASARRLALGGGVLGLAALTRPVALLIWPALALCAWRARGLRGLSRALWVAAAAACVIAPWTFRNWRVHGSLVPIATHGGFIIARSNADAPAWRQQDGWGISPEVFAATPSETERDRLWLREGLGWIKTHPGAYLRLVGERFVRLWYFLRPEYNFWFMLVLPLALLGLWQLRHAAPFCPLIGYVGVSVTVFSTLLYGSTRFRLPLEPVLLIAAAAAAREGWLRLGAARMSGLLSALVLVHAVLWWQGAAVRMVVVTVLQWSGLR